VSQFYFKTRRLTKIEQQQQQQQQEQQQQQQHNKQKDLTNTVTPRDNSCNLFLSCLSQTSHVFGG